MTNVHESFNENYYNGLVLQGKFIPEELLTDILLRVDSETLNACQLVCKRWLFIIQKKNFGRNLIKHKVNYKSVWDIHPKIHWNLSPNMLWKVEISPINAPPYPKDPKIKQISMCYVPYHHTSFLKSQTIDLIQEGFTESILDSIQPTVKVSEWYTCEYGGWALYKCVIELVLERCGNKEIVKKSFSNVLKDNQNKWFRFEHEFKNYGRGLRQINFFHGGDKDSFKIGGDTPHKCKMAGACLTLEFPEKDEIKVEED